MPTQNSYKYFSLLPTHTRDANRVTDPPVHSYINNKIQNINTPFYRQATKAIMGCKY